MDPINQSIDRSKRRLPVNQSINWWVPWHLKCTQSINQSTGISKSVFSLNFRGLQVLIDFWTVLGDEKTNGNVRWGRGCGGGEGMNRAGGLGMYEDLWMVVAMIWFDWLIDWFEWSSVFACCRLTNITAANAIMDAVRTEVHGDYGYKYSPENVRIITGEEEGAYGWMTANFLSKTLPPVCLLGLLSKFRFFFVNVPLPWMGSYRCYVMSFFLLVSPQDQGSFSYGALDLGGASTQLSFVPHNASNFTTTLKLFSQEYDLYSHSYLCYGLREAGKFFSWLIPTKTIGIFKIFNRNGGKNQHFLNGIKHSP